MISAQRSQCIARPPDAGAPTAFTRLHYALAKQLSNQPRRRLLRPATGPATPRHSHQCEPAQHGPPLAPREPLRSTPLPADAITIARQLPLPLTDPTNHRQAASATRPRPGARPYTALRASRGRARISCRYWPSQQPRAGSPDAALANSFGKRKGTFSLERS